jgi:hypothetical protein
LVAVDAAREARQQMRRQAAPTAVEAAAEITALLPHRRLAEDLEL